MNYFDKEPLKGKWRLAKTDKPEYAGIIDLQSAEDPHLVMTDGFNNPFEFPQKRLVYPSIWGDTADLRKATLINCTLFDQDSVDKTIHQSKFNFEYGAFGDIHVYEETKFIKLKFRISSFEQWLNVVLIEQLEGSAGVKYSPLEEKSFETADGKISFVSEANIQSGHLNGNIEASAYVEYELKKSRSLSEAKEVWRNFEAFLEILSGTRCHILELQLQAEHSLGWVHIITPSRYPSKPSVSYLPMLCPFYEIETSFAEVFNSWTAMRARFIDELVLYERCCKARSEFSSFDFLAMTQIIEGLHRKNNPKATYMDPKKFFDEVFTPVTASLPSVLDSDHRNSLKNKIKYGNEVSLRRRLIDLAKNLTSTQQSWVNTDLNTFVTSVVNQRNVLTHFSDEVSNGLLPKSIFIAFGKLQLILEIQLFKSIGISDKIIEKHFPRTLIHSNLIEWEFKTINNSAGV
ncbi:MAG: HEPN domain-containing protein [Pseudobdellovibrio sp.]